MQVLTEKKLGTLRCVKGDNDGEYIGPFEEYFK